MGKKYTQYKNETYELYKKNKFIFCNSLKENIYFDDRGFRHMVFKGKRRRIIADQIRRFRIFFYSYQIIENEQVFKYIKKDGVQFWSIKKNINKKNIIVVIRQIKSGKKHFFSIMHE